MKSKHEEFLKAAARESSAKKYAKAAIAKKKKEATEKEAAKVIMEAKAKKDAKAKAAKIEAGQKKTYKAAEVRNGKKKCVCTIAGEGSLSVTRKKEQKSWKWSGKKFGKITCKGCSGVKLYDDDSWGVKDVTIFDKKWNKRATKNCCIQDCSYEIKNCFLHDLCNDVKKITLYNTCGPKRL